MAKNFKEIEGQIEQINEPRFAKDRRVWVLMVKANGSWRALVSKDGEKIKTQYELLKSKQIAQSINLSVQATNLSASKVRLAEYAYSLIEKHSSDDEALMEATTAAEALPISPTATRRVKMVFIIQMSEV
jgi:hypothetical protein